MKHLSAGVGLICMLAVAGCDRGRADDAELNAGSRTQEVEGIDDANPISVTGCLTSQGDRFVLTNLEEGAAPVASTEMYQLTDADDDLRPHVGKMIQVFGQAPPAQVAQLDQTTPEATGTSGQNDASVETTQTTRFAVATLDVTSVIATDRPCPAAGSTGDRR